MAGRSPLDVKIEVMGGRLGQIAVHAPPLRGEQRGDAVHGLVRHRAEVLAGQFSPRFACGLKMTFTLGIGSSPLSLACLPGNLNALGKYEGIYFYGQIINTVARI